jgi:hypothetical protein
VSAWIPTDWRERVRRPRIRILLVVLALAIVLRIALPTIVRNVAVSQADAALVGRIALEDVDLSLLRGGLTLHGLEVRADELPAEVSPDPEAEKAAVPPAPSAEGASGEPLARIGRLWVHIGWLALFTKTLDVEEVEIADFTVRLDRAQDGALVLPRPVPSEEAAPEEPDEDGPGWALLVSSLRLVNGKVGFFDYAADPDPTPFQVAIEDFNAGNLRLTVGGEGDQPGRVTMQARIEGGSVGIDAQVEMLAAGPRADATFDIQDLPMRNVRLYLKQLGWSDFQGALDARIRHLFETGGAHQLSGTVAVRDVAISVAELDRPALAWQRLDVALGGVDLMKRHADVSSVKLDGLRLPVRPNDPARPLPLVEPLMAKREGGAAPSAAKTPPSGSEPEPAPTAEPAGGAWTWKITEVQLRGAAVDLLRQDEATPIGVSADVKNASSDPSATTTLSLELAPPEGSLRLAGDAVQKPLSFDGKLQIEALSLPKLLAPIEQPAAALVRDGVLSADLALAAGPPSGAGERAARVSGTIGLAGLELSESEAKAQEFGVGWKDLAIGLKEVVVPAALGGEGAAPEPIRASLEKFKLVQPDVRATRSATGIALPAAFGGGEAAAPSQAQSAPAEAAPAPAEAPAAKPGASPVEVRIAQLSIEKGRVRVEDRSVKPFYRSEIRPLDLRASGVRWPGPVVEKLQLDAKTRDGATLAVSGSMRSGATQIKSKLAGLPLAPFNPYAAGTGYGVGGGSASLESEFSMKGDAYESSSRLVLSKLAVTGDQGEALFQQQFGVPLSLALALLTDLQGNIALDIPVTGDRSGTKVGLGSIVGQALTKAILGAVTSPLKMITAVAGAGGAGEAAAPQALLFRRGRAELADGEDARLEQIAALLGRSPRLRIELRGTAGADDLRWLREQALRQEIEDSSGMVGSVRYVGERSERQLAMPVLEQRAKDEPAEVPAEIKDWFEKRVAEQQLPPDALSELAARRAAFLQDVLVTQHGVASERVAVATPAASADGTDPPGVALALGAISSAPASVATPGRAEGSSATP